MDNKMTPETKAWIESLKSDVIARNGWVYMYNMDRIFEIIDSYEKEIERLKEREIQATKTLNQFFAYFLPDGASEEEVNQKMHDFNIFTDMAKDFLGGG